MLGKSREESIEVVSYVNIAEMLNKGKMKNLPLDLAL